MKAAAKKQIKLASYTEDRNKQKAFWGEITDKWGHISNT